jgi:hypothetical protein
MHPTPRGASVVIALESSAATRGEDTALLRDSVRAIPRRERTTIVVFDTSSRVYDVEDAAWRDVAAPRVSGNASLTVGLLAAIREARRLTRDYESVDIVLASTFSRASFDQATQAVRGTWKDSIRVLRCVRRRLRPDRFAWRGDGDDPWSPASGSPRRTRCSTASCLVRTVPTGSIAPGPGWSHRKWPSGKHRSERVDGVYASGLRRSVTSSGCLRPSIRVA